MMTLLPFSETIIANGLGDLDSANPTGADNSPLAPTNLSVSYASNTSLSLTWSDNATDETGYEIDRSLTGADGWSNVTTTAANATSYTDTGLTVDTEYFYRIRALGSSGDSAYATGNATTTSGLIVITGAGFGASGATITNIDEYAYTDPDGTSIPDGVGTPYLDNTVPSNNPLLVDRSIALTGRTGSMRGVEKCLIKAQINRTPKIYISFFQRWDVDLDDLAIFTQTARSDKILRIWDNEQAGNTRISWTKQNITYEDPLGSSPYWGTPIINVGKVNVFQRFEAFAEKGVGFQLYKDGNLQFSTTDYGDNFPADGLYPEMFGYDMSNTAHIQAGQTFTTNVAEMVTLDGHARVEFSNTSSWGTTGEFKRYRQTHTSWSDTEVRIDTPFFSDLDTTDGNVYAHIIDSSGTVQTIGVPTP